MSWLPSRITWPLEALSDLQRDVFHLKLAVLAIPTRLIRMENIMAADRDLLAQIAEGLTALSAPVADLIASEAALRARNAELEGQAAADEAGDVEAAGAVKSAFDNLAGQFAADPEVPDVEPLPEPAPPADEPAPVDEPAPPADEAPADEPPADQPA